MGKNKSKNASKNQVLRDTSSLLYFLSNHLCAARYAGSVLAKLASLLHNSDYNPGNPCNHTDSLDAGDACDASASALELSDDATAHTKMQAWARLNDFIDLNTRRESLWCGIAGVQKLVAPEQVIYMALAALQRTFPDDKVIDSVSAQIRTLLKEHVRCIAVVRQNHEDFSEL